MRPPLPSAAMTAPSRSNSISASSIIVAFRSGAWKCSTARWTARDVRNTSSPRPRGWGRRFEGWRCGRSLFRLDLGTAGHDADALHQGIDLRIDGAGGGVVGDGRRSVTLALLGIGAVEAIDSVAAIEGDRGSEIGQCAGPITTSQLHITAIIQ